MLEARPAQYAVVARLTTGLKRKLGGLRYEPCNPVWQIAELEHRPYGWSQARRFIVARRRIEETEPEPTLFNLNRYLYRAWVTNLPLTPAGVWHFYDGRAGMEPRIYELRENFALRKIPTGDFAANALYLEVIRLAHNLVTSFQQTCLPQDWQDLTLGTLRYRLFWLPGELTRPQNRPTLRLANSPAIQSDFPSGRESRTLKGHSTVIQCIAFSADGKALASGCSDQTIRIWDVESGRTELTFHQPGQIAGAPPSQGFPGQVFAVAFSPDGSLLASGGGDGVAEYGELVLWDLKRKHLRQRLLRAGEQQVWSVAFTPDGKRLVSGQVNGRLKVFNVQTGTAVGQM